jgi:murein DD-endopeptidase MepM/ murein hydrolase activator NlpD
MFRLVLLLTLLLTGCGTYRTGGGYNGMGELRPPSDYSKSYDTSQDTAGDEGELRGRLNGASTYAPHAAFKLHWPVQRVQINRGFHPPEDPKHEGIDFGGKRGIPVLAAHEGLVIYAGREFKGYGKMVLLEYDREWATLYAHLDEFSVREGQVLHAGEPVGAMGSTGDATGVHLHFELMHHREPVDPVPMLSQNSKYARHSRP